MAKKIKKKEVRNYSLYERLRILRSAFNMTQKDFAKMIGVSDRTIRRVESGTLKPESRTVVNYARILTKEMHIDSNFVLMLHDNSSLTGVYNIEAYKKLLDLIKDRFKREGDLSLLKYSGKNYINSDISYELNCIIKNLMNEIQRVVGLEEITMTNTIDQINKRFELSFEDCMNEYYTFLEGIFKRINSFDNTLKILINKSEYGYKK